MNRPSPALVLQNAARPLPAWVLWLLGGVYVLAGFVGRSPWKGDDADAFAFMLALARPDTPNSAWWQPQWLGMAPPQDALLPYWLGAWAVQLAPSDWAWAASRLPFMALLGLTMVALWHAVQALARHPNAQPVALAFGGEATPGTYSRTLADAAVLALLASLGLARAGHEAAAGVVQMASASALLYGLAALPGRRLPSLVAAALGLLGLTLSGAPSTALLLGLGGLALRAQPRSWPAEHRIRMLDVGLLALALLTAVLLAGMLDLWRWRLQPAQWWSAHHLRLLAWFTWPTWPLVLWGLWRWRRQCWRWVENPHLSLPLWFMGVTLVSAWLTGQDERALLVGLPALAALAALALPTLRRSVSALIDWFTLLFFSLCGLVIWVVWLAMQTGWPATTAANVTRTAPGFEPTLVWAALWPALGASLGWLLLVRWRAGRHRSALWKSLILPAGGAVLCWTLLTSLWLPLLDYGRSYGPLVQRIHAMAPHAGCVQVLGLSPGAAVALRWHAGWQVRPAAAPQADCNWLVIDREDLATARLAPGWQEVGIFRRPSDKREDWVLMRASEPASNE
ncbi:MAG: hypothetical protein ACKOXL_09265 [Limnohabitans sp.]